MRGLGHPDSKRPADLDVPRLSRKSAVGERPPTLPRPHRELRRCTTCLAHTRHDAHRRSPASRHNVGRGDRATCCGAKTSQIDAQLSSSTAPPGSLGHGQRPPGQCPSTNPRQSQGLLIRGTRSPDLRGERKSGESRSSPLIGRRSWSFGTGLKSWSLAATPASDLEQWLAEARETWRPGRSRRTAPTKTEQRSAACPLVDSSRCSSAAWRRCERSLPRSRSPPQRGRAAPGAR